MLSKGYLINRVVNALGLDPKPLGVDKGVLKPVFGARNQIIHELDIDLESDRRKRILRGMNDMIEWTDHVLGLTKAIIEAVDKLIPRFRRKLFPHQ